MSGLWGEARVPRGNHCATLHATYSQLKSTCDDQNEQKCYLLFVLVMFSEVDQKYEILNQHIHIHGGEASKR